MGARGPQPRRGSAAQKAVARRRKLGQPVPPKLAAAGQLVVSQTQLPAPALPVGLEPASRLWSEAWVSPGLAPDRDQSLVEELCVLEVEQGTYRQAIVADGPTLSEPVVSPTGEVVGTHVVAHPLIAQLRRLEATALSIRSMLGLSPRDRVRLGIDVAEGQRRVSELDQMLAASEQRRTRSHA
jgi:P27 family predicted phage terminase small subunit